MACSFNEFIRDYLKAIEEGYAAIFAGAGLSRSSGYVDWKELLNQIAQDIGLDVEKEHDLVQVAQFYKNEKRGRSNINQLILNEFSRSVNFNENLEIITRLPITTYWTTNYDHLIEESLIAQNRKPDVKIVQDNLANNISDRDAVVYKMHGDISDPSNAVITKDDYESFNLKRMLFSTALQGDLVSKTFLFIGFSFEDPNLGYVLSRIRVLLGENRRSHYCFLKEINRGDFTSDDDYQYAKVRQNLRVDDLQRYGINAVMVNSYDDITLLLSNLEKKFMTRSILISGSAVEFGSKWTNETAVNLIHNMSRSLIKKNLRIISGYGLGIGSYVINGALEEIKATKYMHVNEHLCMRPFPLVQSGSETLENLIEAYREELVSLCGIVIFVFGNKIMGEKLQIAEGVTKEFEIARNKGKFVIPIGSTGFASKQIFEEIKKDSSNYPYIEDYLEILENETDVNKIINTILKIVEGIRNER